MILTSLAGKCHKSSPLKNIRSIPRMHTACFELFMKWKDTEIMFPFSADTPLLTQFKVMQFQAFVIFHKIIFL